VSAGYPSARAFRGRPARRVRVFPGEPARVAEARAFVAAALAGCTARETLLTCVSEFAANAIAHTASGTAGGVFEVEVSRPADGRAMVAVTDAGGPGVPSACDPHEPSLRDADELAEGGRGLALVAALASRWGHYPVDGGGRTVWAEVTWPVPVRQLEKHDAGY
jgi:anti-sigma regulatory factor (Ser/Thr protein kinase)